MLEQGSVAVTFTVSLVAGTQTHGHSSINPDELQGHDRSLTPETGVLDSAASMLVIPSQVLDSVPTLRTEEPAKQTGTLALA